MTPEIVVTEEPSTTDRDAVVRPLIAFNESVFGPSGFRPLAILLRDPATGGTVGGLWAKSSYGWLYVELLFVPEGLRRTGIGRTLVARAETEAAARGCAGVWLDAFGMDAPEFYERLGYRAFGTLDDHPLGSRRSFLAKRFEAHTG